MDSREIAVIAVFLCFFVPIAGLTLRFALKPIVESIARLLELRATAAPSAAAAELTERRIALLEAELGAMRQELQRVVDQKDFMDRLGSGS